MSFFKISFLFFQKLLQRHVNRHFLHNDLIEEQQQQQQPAKTAAATARKTASSTSSAAATPERKSSDSSLNSQDRLKARKYASRCMFDPYEQNKSESSKNLKRAGVKLKYREVR